MGSRRSKDAELTDNLVQICQESIGMECCMHLCCTESEWILVVVHDDG